MVSGNYTFANKTQSAFTFLPAAARSVRMDPVFLSSTDIPHSFKANWLWELPFGRGRRFGAGTQRLRQRAARRLGFLRDRAVPDAAVLDRTRAGSSA